MEKKYLCKDCGSKIIIDSPTFDLGPYINCPCSGVQELQK
jgi:DNA-directed RNA polymerase subunit RPC12/RpoP